jgi:hypothetical protein
MEKNRKLVYKEKRFDNRQKKCKRCEKNVFSNNICVIIKFKFYNSSEKISMQLLHGMKVKTHSKEPQVLLYIKVQMR